MTDEYTDKILQRTMGQGYEKPFRLEGRKLFKNNRCVAFVPEAHCESLTRAIYWFHVTFEID